MALTKIPRGLLDTGIADSSDATAITIDSSENVTISGNLNATLTTAAQPNITSVGTLTTLTVDDITINGSTISDGGDLTIDVTGNLILDADGGEFKFQDGGTDFARIFQSSGNFYLNVPTQDTDLIIQGNDGGSNVSALTLDMSEAGAATFSGEVLIPEKLTHAGDTDTHFKFAGANDIRIVAGNVEHAAFDGTIVFNQSGADMDFRVESSGNQNMLHVDAGNNRVGIGTNSASSTFHVYEETANTNTYSNIMRLESRSSGTTVAGFGGAIYFLGERNGDGALQGMGRIVSDADVNSGTTLSSGMGFYTATAGTPTQKLRISHDGIVIIGGTDVHETRVNQKFAITEGGQRGGMTINSFYASAAGPLFDFNVSRNNTAGSHTIVQSGDALGTFIWRGDDGGEFVDAGAIECNVDATPGDDDMPGRLSFFTSPDGTTGLQERMRIRCDGDVHIGAGAISGTTSANNYALLTVHDNNVNRTGDTCFYASSGGTADWTARIGGGYEYALLVDTVSSAHYGIGLIGSGTWNFRVNGAGTIYSQTTSISSISDRRLKENITDAKSQWEDLKALKWKNFNWTEESGRDTSKPLLGLIADEVEKVSPNLIEIDAQPKEDIDAGKEDPEYKTVKYSIVWMKAMKALQEAMERIETLEAEVKTLKGG